MHPFKRITCSIYVHVPNQTLLLEVIMRKFEKNLNKTFDISTGRTFQQGASSSPGTPSPGGLQSLWPRTEKQTVK